MISPQPPRFRIKRRNTVSVTPAIGASTVAGRISTPPSVTEAGTWRLTATASPLAGPSQYLRIAPYFTCFRPHHGPGDDSQSKAPAETGAWNLWTAGRITSFP